MEITSTINFLNKCIELFNTILMYYLPLLINSNQNNNIYIT